MKFKEFRDKTKILNKKAGLEHPVSGSSEKNEPQVGKDLNSVAIPVQVNHELEGNQGKRVLKVKDGKYSLEKGVK